MNIAVVSHKGGSGKIAIARYYDPSTARWTQIDPAGSSAPYTYADGNPMNETDPSGQFGVAGQEQGTR